MCRSQSQGGRRCSGHGAHVPPPSREKYRDDIRYGLSERGPEADHAAQIDRQAQEAADRLTREYEAEMRERDGHVPPATRREVELAEFRNRQRNYARTDDDVMYVVETGGAKVTVKGINSAKVVAGKTGTITRK